MACEGVVGYPGSGKSLLAAVMAYHLAEDAKLDPPNVRRRIMANFPVSHDGIELFTTWDEVREVYNSDVFIDESHLWFPAREFQQYGKVGDMVHWAQHRHDDNNLWWLAQSPGQIDVQIRTMFTDHITLCKRLFPPRARRCQHCGSRRHSSIEHWAGHWVVIRKYEAADYGKETKQTRVARKFMRLNRWFGVYDTTYTVGDRTGAGARYGRGHLASAAASGRDRNRLTQETYLENSQALWPGRNGISVWRPTVDGALTDMIAARTAKDAPKPLPKRDLAFTPGNRPAVPAPPEDLDHVPEISDKANKWRKREA